MIRNAKRHCWRLLQRFMRSAEIVKRDIEADRRQMAVNESTIRYQKQLKYLASMI